MNIWRKLKNFFRKPLAEPIRDKNDRLHSVAIKIPEKDMPAMMLVQWMINDSPGIVSPFERPDWDGSEASFKSMLKIDFFEEDKRFFGLDDADIEFAQQLIAHPNLMHRIHNQGVGCGKRHVLKTLRPWEKEA